MLFFSVLYTTEHDCHCYSRSSQSLDRKTCQPAKKKKANRENRAGDTQYSVHDQLIYLRTHQR